MRSLVAHASFAKVTFGVVGEDPSCLFVKIASTKARPLREASSASSCSNPWLSAIGAATRNPGSLVPWLASYLVPVWSAEELKVILLFVILKREILYSSCGGRAPSVLANVVKRKFVLISCHLKGCFEGFLWSIGAYWGPRQLCCYYCYCYYHIMSNS